MEDQLGAGACAIAWAAGLFEADGSASSHLSMRRGRAQPELLVYQAGHDRAPEVLVRFREIVSCGTLLGPARGRLWCWRVSRISEVERVVQLLWPWLGPLKRQQIMSMSRRVSRQTLVSALDDLCTGDSLERAVPPMTDIAWAGGFFVGEGWVGCRLPVPSNPWPQLRAAITQAGASAVPNSLRRFHAAMKGAGSITGPYTSTSPWSRLPQYRWSIASEKGTKAVVERLWPWLDEAKRTQATTALAAFETFRTRRSRRTV
jgi:hypothetical protein